MLKIAVIPSTTRAGRFADKTIPWVMQLIDKKNSSSFEVVDLRDFEIPFFNESMSPARSPSQNLEAQRWQKKVAEFDGYIFLVAEYNRSIPAVLKNGLDFSYPQWARKPAAFVGYGSVGAARAVEHLRLICIELQMAPMRTGVHIQGSDFMSVLQGQKTLEDLGHLNANVDDMLNQLVWWSQALKKAREEG